MSSTKKSPLLRLGSMIGEIYPFFLGNKNETKSYYLYQVGSPEMLEDYTPLLTLSKVGERVPEKSAFQATVDNMYSCDIIAYMLKGRKEIETKAVEFLEKEILGRTDGNHDENRKRRRDRKEDSSVIYKNGLGFPLFEYDRIGNITRSIIVGLRDNLRWGSYRFFVGSTIDILTTRGNHSMFELVGDKNQIKLKYLGTYSNNDPEHMYPVENTEQLARVVKDLTELTFTGDRKASEINRAIRQVEWRSFEIK